MVLSNGDTVHGYFFAADGSPQHEGPELVGELLNRELRFFPFERTDAGTPRTVLYNHSTVVLVSLSEAEASRVPGYAVATRRLVSLLLSTKARIVGTIRIYRPEGRDRVSDWASEPTLFRYVETEHATLLINIEHIVEVSDLEER